MQRTFHFRSREQHDDAWGAAIEIIHAARGEKNANVTRGVTAEAAGVYLRPLLNTLVDQQAFTMAADDIFWGFLQLNLSLAVLATVLLVLVIWREYCCSGGTPFFL